MLYFYVELRIYKYEDKAGLNLKKNFKELQHLTLRKKLEVCEVYLYQALVAYVIFLPLCIYNTSKVKLLIGEFQG